MRNLVNYYENGEFFEGIITHYCEFCKNNMKNEKCLKFYAEFLDSNQDEGICPYGFACKKSSNRVYNGFVLKDKCNLKKLKPKIDKNIGTYSSNDIFDLINIDEELEVISLENDLREKCINDFLHDINKSNKIIEENIKQISKNNLVNKDRNRLLSSIQLTGFFKKRVELYKYVSNPFLVQTGKLREKEAFKLFDMYRKIFEEIGKESDIRIILKNIDMDTMEESNNSTKFEANDSIDVLPFIIIDNALKYSKSASEIYIYVYQSNGLLSKIEIINSPSYIITEDVNNFFLRGYRSENNTSKSSGSGLGLSIVKQICEYNQIEAKLELDSDEFGKQLFKVILQVMKYV